MGFYLVLMHVKAMWDKQIVQPRYHFDIKSFSKQMDNEFTGYLDKAQRLLPLDHWVVISWDHRHTATLETWNPKLLQKNWVVAL